MSIRFRRSIKIAPGVKVNLTKTGVGMTVGPRGAHYSVHSSGRVTRSVGLPGTGLYYQSRTSVQKAPSVNKAPSVQKAPAGRSQAAHTPASTSVVQPSHMVPKPGFLASAAEKAYHRGVLAHLAGDMKTCVASSNRSSPVSPPRVRPICSPAWLSRTSTKRRVPSNTSRPWSSRPGWATRSTSNTCPWIFTISLESRSLRGSPLGSRHPS